MAERNPNIDKLLSRDEMEFQASRFSSAISQMAEEGIGLTLIVEKKEPQGSCKEPS